MTEDIAILDSKLIHKGILHKLIGNGGKLKLNNRFGIEIKYNPNNPDNPMVEIISFLVPLGSQFKGQINPSVARAQAKVRKEEKEEKKKQEQIQKYKDKFELEEGEEIEG